MANGTAKAELSTGDTQSEFIRPQGLANEGAAKKSDRLGVSGALGALRLDKPDVQDRQDLKSLVAHGRKYRHFDTIDQYKNGKAKANGGPQTLRNEQVAQKQSGVNEVDESKRIYEEPHLDPMVREIQDRITTNTNLDPTVRGVLTSGSDNYTKLWYQVNESQNIREWQNYVRDHPDKAAAYAEKHPGIKAALEDIERQELAAARAQTGEQVQSENNQLLADSVRVSDNNPEGPSGEPGAEQDRGEKPSPVVEVSGKETGLLSAETVGVQATLLLGGEIGTQIDKAKIEAIAKGGPINTERANKASLEEREDYWNGENSPFKSMSFEQQLEKWRGTMQAFFDQHKGKPEAEFFKRAGIDLGNENAVREIYQTYFVDGEGDLGLFSQKIAQNNSAEQIQENRAIIERLGKMYGEKSAKVIVEMTMGIKNAQRDIDSFIQAAQADIDKGDNMPGKDLIDTLYNNLGESERNEANQSQEHELIWSQRANLDIWKEGGGDLHLNGDYLAFTPHVARLRNPYAPGTTQYDYFEKYQVKYFKPDLPSDYFIGEQRKRVERGVGLAVNTGTESGPRMALTPMFWEIIEADPESVSGEWADRYITLDQGENPVKSVQPVDLKIHNSEDKPRRVDLNLSWQKLKVDKQTLAAMQEVAIEYVEKQVAAGNLDPDVLVTTKAVVDSHKSPQLVDEKWWQKNPGGENPDNPRTHLSFLRFNENWSNGDIRQENDALVYTNKKLVKNKEQRNLEIAVIDPSTGRKVLTREAWSVLLTVPQDIPNGKNAYSYALLDAESLTNPIKDRQGVWKRFAKPFTANAQTLSRMQGMIRNYVGNQITEGNMDSSVLSSIDGIRKYKFATIEPVKLKYDNRRDRARLDFRKNVVKTQQAVA